MDLARFYYDQGRLEDSEEVLLNATELTEFVIRRSPDDRKPITMIEAALLHNRLARIYEKDENGKLVEKHTELENEYLKQAFTYDEGE
ncbi:hypothetical protein SAMN05192551_101125 [Tindallia magadiensis]|uniref:Tetratricopeptide repeat-containing protein n=1 Tax=Tindallia magadiensis TaxID=69895 RepID=A0A1I3ACK6_9FIRM|nr:hypothetical protein [Tindallia magadiensis]SFH47685.1 hypothetical protein SAMN05192551_101125 [Tindallia magadiensis]